MAEPDAVYLVSSVIKHIFHSVEYFRQFNYISEPIHHCFIVSRHKWLASQAPGGGILSDQWTCIGSGTKPPYVEADWVANRHRIVLVRHRLSARAPCEHQWDQKQWVHSHSRAAGTSQPSFIVLIVFPERLAALPSGGPSHGNRHRCTNTVNSNAMFSYFAIVYFCIMQGLAIFRTIDRLFRILTLIWYVRWLKAVRCGFVSYPLERKHKQCTLSFNIIFQTCFL